jgi:hypothetical protein
VSLHNLFIKFLKFCDIMMASTDVATSAAAIEAVQMPKKEDAGSK